MLKRSIPFALATNVFEIPASFYKDHGVRVLLMDLDNTLDPYTVSSPSQHTVEWAKAMMEEGLEIYILSNNSGKRVGKYAADLGVKARYFMFKPFAGPLKKFMKEMGLAKSEVMLIGDQIQTDVLAGNGAGIRVILTEPTSPVEPLSTKINRIFDRPKRKKIKANHLCPTWQEV